MKTLNPYFVFLAGSCITILIIILVDTTLAGIILGGLIATLLDPPILLIGLILGFIGENYKRFSMVLYPIAIAVSIILVLTVINPWLQTLQRPSAGLWVYAAKAYAIILLAHLVGAGRVFYKRQRNLSKGGER